MIESKSEKKPSITWPYWENVCDNPSSEVENDKPATKRFHFH